MIKNQNITKSDYLIKIYMFFLLLKLVENIIAFIYSIIFLP